MKLLIYYANQNIQLHPIVIYHGLYSPSFSLQLNNFPRIQWQQQISTHGMAENSILKTQIVMDDVRVLLKSEEQRQGYREYRGGTAQEIEAAQKPNDQL